MKFLLHPPVSAERLARIVQAAGANATVVNCADEAEAIREIADADGMFGYLTPPLLAAAKQLRWVQSPTASMEKFLHPALVESPVIVSNMRGIFSDVIADHVFAFVLCFAKNFHTYIRQQSRRHWQMLGRTHNELPGYGGPGEVHPSDLRAMTLADCALGVVGAGGIGGEVCRRGVAFGMKVIAVDPATTAPPAPGVDVWPQERLDEMLGLADFVVIAAPHTPETYKLFNRTRIGKMKKSAYLINVGRGVIVDLADLTAALQAGEIGGAGLDVFETEPLPGDHPLWGMDNVIITPHCAAASPRVTERHSATLLDNLRRFASGKPLLNVVDKRKWC